MNAEKKKPSRVMGMFDIAKKNAEEARLKRQGDIIYIVQGWTYNPEAWDKTISALKKSDIKVKFIKIPGLMIPSDDVFTIEDYVKYVRERVPEGAIVLGHSNGGRILLNLLQDDSERFRRIILLDSAGIYEKSKKRDVSRVLSKIFGFMKKIPLAKKVVYKLLGVSDYNNAPENMKKTLQNMLESDKKLDFEKITKNLENAGNLATEIRIVWGENDQSTPLRQGKKMHELLPGSTFRSLEGWGHSEYLHRPKELAEVIAEELRA